MRRYKLLLTFGVIAGFYLWLVRAAVTPELPSPNKPIHFYSNQLRCDLKQTLAKAIAQAKKEIVLTSYSVTDVEILSLLVQKARTGVEVSIVYDPSASMKLTPMREMATLHPIFCQGLMHRKIAIIDGSTVLLGTANVTPTSLSMHDNLIVGLHHPSLAEYLKDPSELSFHFNIGEMRGELWMLPDKKGLALSRIIDELNSAKGSIYLSIFTLTHPVLVQALIEAKQRGVDVRVAVDANAAKGSSKKAVDLLQKSDIPIYLSGGIQLLHHKWAWIDEQTLIVGSANWTKAAFMKNRDDFMILGPLEAPQKNFMNDLWKTILSEAKILDQS